MENSARELTKRLVNATNIGNYISGDVYQPPGADFRQPAWSTFPSYYFYDALEHVLDLFLDIVTLCERIAGRSPAFEGIRLVKERK